MIITIIKPNNYLDSIFLMKTTKEVLKAEGVVDAVVVMGSDMNKTVLAEFGGLTDEAKAAGANDLIISLDVDNENAVIAAEKIIDTLMTEKTSTNENTDKQKVYNSFDEAKEAAPESNLAIISLPGEYAAYEAKRALKSGMHVFIFSDLPLEKELELKNIGSEKNLLVMGPGAGTAIIDGVSIGLMSRVRRGSIGIAAASGSGLQEVAMLIHKAGLGVSQAIGTGGRDLSKEVAGSMMLRALKFFEEDEDTKVVVLVSKPPHPETMGKILKQVKRSSKPVVVFFLGGDPKKIHEANAWAPATLEEAAEMACKLAVGETPVMRDYVSDVKSELKEQASKLRKKLSGDRKYLRGLFCGGTHSEEVVTLLQDFVPDLYSNIRFGKTNPLENRHISMKNSLVDMGDEEFTKGRPHPVMDPTILCDRMLQEGEDPETAVILFDIILGYGVHLDPVGCIEDTIKRITTNNDICVIASVCGTDLDPQNMEDQIRRLENLGVVVLPSNGRAALLAGLIVIEE